MTKQIHVKLGYGPLSDKDVATQGVAVVDGLTNNAKLTNPPINPADLKADQRIVSRQTGKVAEDDQSPRVAQGLLIRDGSILGFRRIIGAHTAV